MDLNNNDGTLRSLSSKLSGSLRWTISRSSSQGSQIVPVDDCATAHDHQEGYDIVEVVDLERAAECILDAALEAQVAVAPKDLQTKTGMLK
jgi:hypothetical protein